MKSRSVATAAAPSTTANLGPGYDVFGLALDALEDRVTIRRAPGKDGLVTIMMAGTTTNAAANLGSDSRIPERPESNSAGLVVLKMAKDFGISDNLTVEVEKGVPAGYGMGSSAASAAAAAVAFKALYGLKVDSDGLVEYAAEGEVASAGARHYDNVSASVLGGFVITTTTAAAASSTLAECGGKATDAPRPKFIRMAPPRDLVLVVAVPSIPVPEKKTEAARRVLPKDVPLKSAVHNVSGASAIVAGVALGDVEVMAAGIMRDIIVEPARKHLIPGYDAVRGGALGAGALAVTISGAGPSMIAFLKGAKNAKKVAEAMAAGFESAGAKSQTFVCRPSRGARIMQH